MSDLERERDALLAENANLREVLQEAYSALAAMTTYPGATVPAGLAKRIREALNERPG